MKIKEWIFKDAEWYEFWRPGSGLVGGIINGAIIGGLLAIIYTLLN